MIEIRKATGADAAAILEYCRQVGGETDNLTFGSEGVSFTLQQEKDYLNSIHDSESQLYLIALHDSEVVGTGCYSGYTKPRLSHRGEISIAVKKDFWGNGIATRFLEEMIRFAKETAKAEIISLEVRSDNDRAISLYRKFGFEKIGTFDGFMKIGNEYIPSDIMWMHL